MSAGPIVIELECKFECNGYSPHLSGRWTTVQIRALQEAGWIAPFTKLLDVTTFADTCRWWVIWDVTFHVPDM